MAKTSGGVRSSGNNSIGGGVILPHLFLYKIGITKQGYCKGISEIKNRLSNGLIKLLPDSIVLQNPDLLYGRLLTRIRRKALNMIFTNETLQESLR